MTSHCGGELWNSQFLVFLPYRCYIPNLVKIGPVVFEKKILTDNAQQTSDDTRHTKLIQPIAKGHLSDSGDLKTKGEWHFPPIKNASYLWNAFQNQHKMSNSDHIELTPYFERTDHQEVQSHYPHESVIWSMSSAQDPTHLSCLHLKVLQLHPLLQPLPLWLCNGFQIQFPLPQVLHQGLDSGLGVILRVCHQLDPTGLEYLHS